MYKSIIILPIILTILLMATSSNAQGPEGKDFGFGLVVGQPLGATVKYWTAADQAIVGSIGASYFGEPRLNADYHWHFNAFKSDVAKLYAGPGLSVGFGNGRYYGYYNDHGKVYYFIREPGETGFGARLMMGLNVIPRRTPIEIFLELGPLIGISPGFGVSFDVAAGLRFYP
jgi:hypothetical protein